MPIETVKRHSAFIMDRGGKRRIAELANIDRVVWNRVRDNISGATVHISTETNDSQADLLDHLIRATGRYELCLFRDDERVWEGPLTLPSAQGVGFTIDARDVMHYPARTIMRQAYDNSTVNVDYVTNRAELILQTELARWEALDPPINVVEHIVNHHAATDAKTSKKTPPYYSYVHQDIDQAAMRSGIDYTVIGRAIHLWDTSRSVMGQTPTVTENDFLGDVAVSAYGMELATIAAVTDGQGGFATAGAADPYYGLWEHLATAYDEDQTALPTSAELQSQAQRNLSGRNPTPIQVRVPDNSSVNMDGVLEVKHLVPGIYVPLRSNFGVTKLTQMQKLQTVRVTETAEGETVKVTFYPASDPDVEEEP